MIMRATISLSLALALASTVCWARQGHVAHHRLVPSAKARHTRSATRDRVAIRTRRRHPTQARMARQPERHAEHHRAARRETRRVLRDRRAIRTAHEHHRVPRLRVIGRREVGRAAWYGPHFLGRRTASGERLDRIHATAAHRWLPLNSLVRITNLRNGRTAVATINDRGPFTPHVLIDLSPRTARELHMVQAGVVPVVVVPVARRAR
jgi:rare lipoprotein A (peptidoglycan hydrolase)